MTYFDLQNYFEQEVMFAIQNDMCSAEMVIAEDDFDYLVDIVDRSDYDIDVYVFPLGFVHIECEEGEDEADICWTRNYATEKTDGELRVILEWKDEIVVYYEPEDDNDDDCT